MFSSLENVLKASPKLFFPYLDPRIFKLKKPKLSLFGKKRGGGETFYRDLGLPIGFPKKSGAVGPQKKIFFKLLTPFFPTFFSLLIPAF